MVYRISKNLLHKDTPEKMEECAKTARCLHSGLQKSVCFAMPRNYGPISILTEKTDDADWSFDAYRGIWSCDANCSILKISFALPSCCAFGAS